jgi:hypothetical protein
MKQSSFVCVFSIALLFLIFGCVKSGSWVKNNVSQEQLKKDYEECRGPTGYIYTKEGATIEEHERDFKGCKEEAEVRTKHVEATTKVLSYTQWLVGMPGSIANITVLWANAADYCQRCLKRKGYKIEQRELNKKGSEISACMREKGYEWR